MDKDARSVRIFVYDVVAFVKETSRGELSDDTVIGERVGVVLTIIHEASGLSVFADKDAKISDLIAQIESLPADERHLLEYMEQISR